MVCMNGKVVPSRGLIHYLASNHAKKMTWQAGGLAFGSCAFVMLNWKTTHAAIGLIPSAYAPQAPQTSFPARVSRCSELSYETGQIDQRVAAQKQKGVGTPYIPPMTHRLKCDRS